MMIDMAVTRVINTALAPTTIDNFILRLQVFNYLELYVTSHPEYIPWASWSTFPLKSVLNTTEFEIRALANCTVFSNKTNANQFSARV